MLSQNQLHLIAENRQRAKERQSLLREGKLAHQELPITQDAGNAQAHHHVLAGNERLTFGKYVGKTFGEVALQDSGYCSWARSQENPTGQLVNFSRFLKMLEPGRNANTSFQQAPKRPADKTCTTDADGVISPVKRLKCEHAVAQLATPARSTAVCATLRLQHTYLELIKSGRKRWEGRLSVGAAASLRKCDRVRFSSGRVDLDMVVQSVRKYQTFKAMLIDLGVETCLPDVRSLEAGVAIYHSFPGYAQKELQHGVVAFELIPAGASLTFGI